MKQTGATSEHHTPVLQCRGQTRGGSYSLHISGSCFCCCAVAPAGPRRILFNLFCSLLLKPLIHPSPIASPPAAAAPWSSSCRPLLLLLLLVLLSESMDGVRDGLYRGLLLDTLCAASRAQRPYCRATAYGSFMGLATGAKGRRAWCRLALFNLGSSREGGPCIYIYVEGGYHFTGSLVLPDQAARLLLTAADLTQQALPKATTEALRGGTLRHTHTARSGTRLLTTRTTGERAGQRCCQLSQQRICLAREVPHTIIQAARRAPIAALSQHAVVLKVPIEKQQRSQRPEQQCPCSSSNERWREGWSISGTCGGGGWGLICRACRERGRSRSGRREGDPVCRRGHPR